MFELIFRNPARGFRFSPTDAVAILACGAATAVAWPVLGPWALAMPYVLGHFFLFCNVFRVRRSFELIWSGVFLLNTGAILAFVPEPVWPALFQLPVTVAVIRAEWRSANYHGIGA